MAGEAGDGGSSQQPPQVGGKGKEPLSPSSDTVPAVDEKVEEDAAPAVEDGKGKTVVAEEDDAPVVEDSKGKKVVPEENLINDLESKAPAVAPLAQVTVDDSGKGKRAAEPSGASVPKKLRKAGGSPTRRGKALGPYVVPAIVGNPAVGIGVGISNPAMSLITSDSGFMDNAAASAVVKGYIPLTAPLPGSAPPPQPGAQLCINCNAAEATTSLIGPGSHRCICGPCERLVARAPLLAQCPLCREHAITLWAK